MRPIEEVAADLRFAPDNLQPWGPGVAKVNPEAAFRADPLEGKLVLVSAINPTRAGEGKTTCTIGLTQAARRLGARAACALREPSLGPVFGAKGGGTGGGKSMLVPSERINLHFTGDIHAVTTAHNLLAALVDNDVYFGTLSRLDSRRISIRRVIDLNDRFLRRIVIGLGGHTMGIPREDGFDITAASEVMAILCLASDYVDLKARLGRILVGFGRDGTPVRAGDLRAEGAMSALLRDAMLPNLVQTTEGAPALVHGGPFGNIAHGCNSIIVARAIYGAEDVDFSVTSFRRVPSVAEVCRSADEHGGRLPRPHGRIGRSLPGIHHRQRFPGVSSKGKARHSLALAVQPLTFVAGLGDDFHGNHLERLVGHVLRVVDNSIHVDNLTGLCADIFRLAVGIGESGGRDSGRRFFSFSS